MSTPDTYPSFALVAPTPRGPLDELAAEEDGLLEGLCVVDGAGPYRALVDYRPGEAHGKGELEIALKLSRACDGPVYAISFHEDLPRVTECTSGAITRDARQVEADGENVLRRLGLDHVLPPAP